MGKKRDDFRESERAAILRINAAEVKQKWPSIFASKSINYYMCENCLFVHNDDGYFDIDHIVPCARGGTTGRENTGVLDAAWEADDVQTVMRIGMNFMVLCGGCNRSKGARETINMAASYAYTKPNEDCNPDQHRGS